MSDAEPSQDLDIQSTIPSAEAPANVEAPVVEAPVKPVLKTDIILRYPQTGKPQLSINGSEFEELPWMSIKKVITVEGQVFPLKVVFKDQFRTYAPIIFDNYGSVDQFRITPCSKIGSVK